MAYLSTSYKQRRYKHRLNKELEDWEASQRIRAYVAAMQNADQATDENRAEFLAWARRYADHLDPAVDFRIEVLDD